MSDFLFLELSEKVGQFRPTVSGSPGHQGSGIFTLSFCRGRSLNIDAPRIGFCKTHLAPTAKSVTLKVNNDDESSKR